LLLVLAAFSILTALALWQHGYWGIFAPLLQSTAGAQVLVDLVIALGLVMVWMWRDARENGRVVWPWLVFTLLAGSFGPLGYLLGKRTPAPDHSRSSRP
jgi:hypothetical protein